MTELPESFDFPHFAPLRPASEVPEFKPYPYLYAQGKQWVPLEDVRKAWQAWKDAWGTGDSEEAFALMEMDTLLGVDENGRVL